MNELRYENVVLVKSSLVFIKKNYSTLFFRSGCGFFEDRIRIQIRNWFFLKFGSDFFFEGWIRIWICIERNRIRNPAYYLKMDKTFWTYCRCWIVTTVRAVRIGRRRGDINGTMLKTHWQMAGQYSEIGAHVQSEIGNLV